MGYHRSVTFMVSVLYRGHKTPIPPKLVTFQTKPDFCPKVKVRLIFCIRAMKVVEVNPRYSDLYGARPISVSITSDLLPGYQSTENQLKIKINTGKREQKIRFTSNSSHLVLSHKIHQADIYN